MGRYMKPTKTALGAYIRKKRLALGMTLMELGETTGIHFQQLGRYELGDRCPSLVSALVLAEALSCTVEDLANEAKKDR